MRHKKMWGVVIVVLALGLMGMKAVQLQKLAVTGHLVTGTAEVQGNATVGGTLTVAGAITATTDLTVANGGTGASTLTDHGVLVGSGTDAVTVLAVGANNQVLRGATGADPAFGALVDADIPDSITVTNYDTKAESAATYGTLASIFASVDVATAPVSATQATITVTCKDLAGDTLAATKAITFWFTAPGQDTTPSEEGIESWSFVSHGDLQANMEVGDPELAATTNYIRIATTHTDGTMDFLVTIAADAGPWTNTFHVLGPLGDYDETTIEYITP